MKIPLKSIKENSRQLIIITFITFSSISYSVAQSMHDSWMRGQSSWRMDMGLSIGPTSGLQFQYFTPRRSTCKTLNKKIAFDFGIYYEGLIFSKTIEPKLTNWESGGYRGNISMLYYLNSRIKANRFFFGGGIESGTRKIDGTHLLQTDFIAKLGWELSFMPLINAPIVLRLSIKYDKCLNNEYSYILPTIGLVLGK